MRTGAREQRACRAVPRSASPETGGADCLSGADRAAQSEDSLALRLSAFHAAMWHTMYNLPRFDTFHANVPISAVDITMVDYHIYNGSIPVALPMLQCQFGRSDSHYC